MFHKKITSMFIVFFLALLVMVSGKKTYGNSISIEPAEEVGTFIFQGYPKALLNHPIIQGNSLINNKLKLGIAMMESSNGSAGKGFTKRIVSVSGLYSLEEGVQRIMIRVDGDFKGVSWEELFKGKFKRSRLRGLGRGEKLFQPEDIDKPSIIVSSSKMIIAPVKQILKANKTLGSRRWKLRLKKEFSSKLIDRALSKRLLMVSYTPPKKAVKGIHERMKSAPWFAAVPIYLPMLTSKRSILGIGQSGDNVQYYWSVEFSNPQDVKDVKGILIGGKHLSNLLFRNMKPIKKLVDKMEIVGDAKTVAIKGSINPTDVKHVIAFVKERIKAEQNYRKTRKKRIWEYTGKERREIEKRRRDEAERLIKPIFKAFTSRKYRDLSRLITKPLKVRLYRKRFMSISKEINALGKVSKINITYAYTSTNDLNKEYLYASGKITFQSKGKETIRNFDITFIKEKGKYKLNNFNLR